MEPRLTRAEYWLLNYVVESFSPICFLGASDPLEAFNNPGHRLPRHRLIAVLFEMFQKSWIEARRFSDPGPVGPLSYDQIAAAYDLRTPAYLNDVDCFYYCLTQTGGAIWESFAAPDWDRFLDVSNDSPGAIVGATEWRVRRYFSMVHNLGVHPLSETVQWDAVHPWQAVYWKQLPVGYRVRFDYTRDDFPPRWDLVSHEFVSLSQWYDWR